MTLDLVLFQRRRDTAAEHEDMYSEAFSAPAQCDPPHSGHPFAD